MIEQLDVFDSLRTPQDLRKFIAQKRVKIRKSAVRARRSMMIFLRSQYYVSNAARDTRRAFKLNEDIALASLLIAGVIYFSSVSVLANALYTFMLAAAVLSTVFGINLALLAAIAITVIIILVLWVTALHQNMLAVSLMEGLNRKVKRSLRLTFRKSLKTATATATVWMLVALLSLGPAFGAVLSMALILHKSHIQMAGAAPYLAVTAFASVCWVAFILANYSLAAYVVLFEKFTGWRTAFRRSRELVSKKGRCFILSGYVAVGFSLAGLYALSLVVQSLTRTSSTLLFLLLSGISLSAGNAGLTMLYRKRRLARK